MRASLPSGAGLARCAQCGQLYPKKRPGEIGPAHHRANTARTKNPHRRRGAYKKGKVPAHLKKFLFKKGHR